MIYSKDDVKRILDEILLSVHAVEAHSPFGPVRLGVDLVFRDDLIKKIDEIKARL